LRLCLPAVAASFMALAALFNHKLTILVEIGWHTSDIIVIYQRLAQKKIG
jgi:hypothetical protein